MQMPTLQSFADNGDKAAGTFSKREFNSRHAAIRAYMSTQQIDAVLFSSYHNICYYADFLYCYFGRNYALVIDHDNVTSVSAGIDGGQPWRRTRGDNITYTDWHKDNYFCAIKQLTKNVKRLGIEFDHCTLDQLSKLKQAFPAIEFVDIASAAMGLRMIKSAEEIAHIKKMTRIADIGGAACVEAAKVGVSEVEVALHSTATMVRAIAKTWPNTELLDTWTWFQSGLNTDGAHNPVTSKIIAAGDILSLNCFPMVAGYYVALERTLFAGHVTDEQLRLWEINVLVHERGQALLVAGNKCSEIAKELNQLYAEYDLLQYRSFGYGHSFGVLGHYYGREAGLELREDCDTVLVPGMVVSMEPMITIPNHLPGAGGYREHDILVITAQGNENITEFPYGPEHLIIG
ncbi:MAG: M24 family metallopeptidase [Oceanospirillaceae bacterium]|nr:M24 family metallopeptidase [Oceanospirillaceae bacterium]